MADWQTISVLAVPIFVGYLAWLWFRYENLLAIALRATFFIYVVAVISVTLFPMPVTAQEIDYYRALPVAYQLHNNLVPLASVHQVLTVLPPRPALIQLAGNLLLLLPLGYLAELLWPRMRAARDAVLVAVVASLSIECTQFLISAALGSRYKSFDVDDMILNVVGGFAGYLIFRVFAPHMVQFDFTLARRSAS